MQVSAGKYKGIKLKTLEGESTRPTLSRIKEAMFNILQFEIANKVVLDLFSGSGSLGIEALSRGAKKVYFNDKSKEACNVINSNLKLLKDDNYELDNLDAFTYLKTKEVNYDVVILDPPYDFKEYEKLFKLLEKRLNDNAIVVIEHYCKDKIFNYLNLKTKEYKYGNKCLTLFLE